MIENPTGTEETYLPCPDPSGKCQYEQWVSPEDQDASFGELWSHVLWFHAGGDQERTSRLMATITEVHR